jgi:HlyD family secretion protein
LRFAVAPGQSVRKGDTLAELSNPELEAGLVLAQAQLGQARALRDRVYAGPRQERVDALARDIDMANANLVYAQQQFNRTSQLAAAGFASHQDLDKATAAAETGNANLSRAKERYEAARLGPTREERAIANAKVEVAVAAVAVIAARVAKLRIRAPSDGAVALLVAEPGEAVVPGQPLMTLEAPGRGWASFNLREDQLDGLSIGLPTEVMLCVDQCPDRRNRPARRIRHLARRPGRRRLRPQHIRYPRRSGRQGRRDATRDDCLAAPTIGAAAGSHRRNTAASSRCGVHTN